MYMRTNIQACLKSLHNVSDSEMIEALILIYSGLFTQGLLFRKHRNRSAKHPKKENPTNNPKKPPNVPTKVKVS